MRNQDRLQQTEQHQSKNHNAVGRCEEETGNTYFLFWCLALLTAWIIIQLKSGPWIGGGWVCTYEWSLVGHGGQDVIQDEQQYRDGQQHGDFEAQLLSSVVSDEEGGEVQRQEEQDGQQEVDDMEEGPPPHGELGKQVQGSGWIDQMTTEIINFSVELTHRMY